MDELLKVYREDLPFVRVGRFQVARGRKAMRLRVLQARHCWHYGLLKRAASGDLPYEKIHPTFRSVGSCYWSIDGHKLPSLLSGEIKGVGVNATIQIRQVGLILDAVFVLLVFHIMMILKQRVLSV